MLTSRRESDVRGLYSIAGAWAVGRCDLSGVVLEAVLVQSAAERRRPVPSVCAVWGSIEVGRPDVECLAEVEDLGGGQPLQALLRRFEFGLGHLGEGREGRQGASVLQAQLDQPRAEIHVDTVRRRHAKLLFAPAPKFLRSSRSACNFLTFGTTT